MDAKPLKPLWRVTLTHPPGWEESLLWHFREAGFEAAVAEQTFPAGLLEGEGGQVGADPEIVVVTEEQEVSRLRALTETVAKAFEWPQGSWRIQVERRQEQDWEALWRKRWKAFRCGNLVVHAEFHDPRNFPTRDRDQPLCLKAGSAFGTGGHASTRLALKVLQRWCRNRPPADLIDLGTGSGILAVAAAVLGVPKVAGMDPDPQSPAQAQETAALNRVAQRCRFWRGTLESAGGRWQAVMANLHSDLVRDHAADFHRLLAPGGRLFVGGILDRKAEGTFLGLKRSDLRLEWTSSRGRWVAGALVKQ
ncbi:MAG: hypothetical protein DWQ01_04140 [Planctomycetota bacterium]|nr:MAG: hypothetical protein DWQ01_04140 [Planctomycetota bacterium]